MMQLVTMQNRQYLESFRYCSLKKEYMNCPSISIVVPIYNVKEYLEQCIESIIIQINELTCVEVILVNDGSSDGSGEIAENYGKKYDFVRVLKT